MTTGRMQSIRSGFTLIELMIAVAVLVVVIVATSRIFSVAGRVTSVGQATSSVLQEAAVIEKRLREDIANLSTDGFFAIRQVAVPNDVHGAGQPLLNPVLPPDAIIRADQLVFFTSKTESMQTARVSQGSNAKGLGTFSRVYYGHAFQLPNGAAFIPSGGANQGRAQDPDPGTFIPPWYSGEVDMVGTLFSTIGAAGPNTATTIFGRGIDGSPASIDATQPEARQWLLTRQNIPLIDDDTRNPNTNAKTVYLGQNQTARSIFRDYGGATPHPIFGWSQEIRNGRMDAAAGRANEVRSYVRVSPTGGLRPWSDETFGSVDEPDQRSTIARAVYYPRAERIAPSMNRIDQALTNHVIGSAVSSFVVEWTYENGVGDVLDERGRPVEIIDTGGATVPLLGFRTNWYGGGVPYQPEQPWFGLNQSDFCEECPDRGVGFYRDSGAPMDPPANDTFQFEANFRPAEAIHAPHIERALTGALLDQISPGWAAYPELRVYEAIFGFNRDEPLSYNPSTGQDEPYNFSPPQPPTYEDPVYTPWPSAIRVTMVLHDPQGVLENGREFQFVIDLPKRVR